VGGRDQSQLASILMTNPDSRPKPPEGPGDNSCTQLGVLGWWTASKAGMQFLIVGAGRAFSRYRESSLYNDWKNNLASK
jgi:hypothetical protein